MPDNSLKRLGNLRKPGKWFTDTLESELESSSSGRVDPGWFHPSDFGHPCDAFLAFRFLGAPSVQATSARLQRIFDLGDARDIALKKLTRKAGISLIKEEKDRKIELPLLHIRGELDDWVKNPFTNQQYVIDYKTMHNEEWISLEAAKPSHVLQIHPYMFAKETYEGFILYENKNTQEWKLLPANFDSNIWQTQIVERIERILDGIRKGYCSRHPIPNDSSCAFYNICSFANIPKLLEESKIEI